MKNFKIRTIGSRIHRAYHYKRKQKTVLRGEQIREWWMGRLTAGMQLRDYSSFKSGFDFRWEPDAWVRHVAVSALNTDFMNYSGRRITDRQFMIELQKLGPFKMVTLPARIVLPSGELFLAPKRRFVRFDSIEQYRRQHGI